MGKHDDLHHRGKRMSPDERRESILAAATVVFGERGYVGATTDQVAKAAGISQAYVVRMFGSKEVLFQEAGSRACERVCAAFREALAGLPDGATGDDKGRALAAAYSRLISDHGTLLTIMNLTMQGVDPHLGPTARDRYLAIYRIIRDEAGMGPEKARDFLARGMLINTLMALRLPDVAADNADARELIDCTFEGKADLIAALSDAYPQVAEARRG